MNQPTSATNAARSVRVGCALGHVAMIDARMISLTHTSDAMVGYRYDCVPCAARTHVTAPPRHIAMLAEFGASPASESLDASALTDNDPHRRIVAVDLLFDDAWNTHATLSTPGVDASKKSLRNR